MIVQADRCGKCLWLMDFWNSQQKWFDVKTFVGFSPILIIRQHYSWSVAMLSTSSFVMSRKESVYSVWPVRAWLRKLWPGAQHGITFILYVLAVLVTLVWTWIWRLDTNLSFVRRAERGFKVSCPDFIVIYKRIRFHLTFYFLLKLFREWFKLQRTDNHKDLICCWFPNSPNVC